MRAVAFSEFGGPEVLTVAELPIPEPGAGEVRIKVAAATVNPTDIGFRARSVPAQLAQTGAKPPYIPGMEAAGVIDAVGPGADWQVGQRVLAIVNPRRPEGGAQAEYIVVPADSVTRVPAGATVREAATLPMNGLTVRLALDLMKLQPGQTLAVTGAAGAVGGYAIELGVNDGLRVIAVASPSDEALVKGMGAEALVPRGEGAVAGIRALVPEGVDGLIDGAVIGAPILGAVKDGGHLAAVRAFEGETERGITIHQVRVMEYLRNRAALDQLADLVSYRKLTLRVAETFPPDRAAEAQQKLDAGGVRGRLVITF